MTRPLSSLSDEQLAEAFSVEVAGGEPGETELCGDCGEPRACHHMGGQEHSFASQCALFASDAAAVLPFLEKQFRAFQWNPDDRCLTWLGREPGATWNKCAFGAVALEDGAFAKAACIALISCARAAAEAKEGT